MTHIQPIGPSVHPIPNGSDAIRQITTNKFIEQPIERGTMQIIVKTLTNRSFVLWVNPQDRVGRIKQMIQDKTCIDPEQQRLIFSEKQLDDHRRLRDYGIISESTIRLVLRLAAGSYYNLNPNPNPTRKKQFRYCEAVLVHETYSPSDYDRSYKSYRYDNVYDLARAASSSYSNSTGYNTSDSSYTSSTGYNTSGSSYTSSTGYNTSGSSYTSSTGYNTSGSSYTSSTGYNTSGSSYTSSTGYNTSGSSYASSTGYSSSTASYGTSNSSYGGTSSTYGSSSSSTYGSQSIGSYRY
jgi:hypothetical protein